MRRIRTLALLCLIALLLPALPLQAQTTYYAALPNARIQFFDNAGLPAAGGLLYTCTAGLSCPGNPQATYTDSTGGTPNANPVVLDGAGRASVWLASTNPYKLVLQTSLSVTLWTQDNVSDFGATLKRDLAASFATKSLDTVRLASQYTGANECAQIAAAIADLPSTGGTVSAIGLQGAQSCTADPFTGVTKPVIVQLGASTTTISTNVTAVASVTLQFSEGSQLSVNGGSTLTIKGGILAPLTQIFAGGGTVSFSTDKVERLYPQWWGAKGDGTTDDAPAFNSALAAASATSTVYVPPSAYKICSPLIVPANVLLAGAGKGSELMDASPSCLGSELVRLNGDYAAVEKLWLHGPGQALNAVDGRRGVWIGCGTSTHSNPFCIANHNRVEDMFIDQFAGNGISGDYVDAKLLNNFIQQTTDAGIFMQPNSHDNLAQGNTVDGTRYSGFDITSSRNRFIGNRSINNGGGNLDEGSQNGFLVGYAGAAGDDITGKPGASENVFIANYADSNAGSGFRVNGLATTAGIVDAPAGNRFIGNEATNHKKAYSDVPQVGLAGMTEWTGGFSVTGGNNNVFIGNLSHDNVFNFVAASGSTSYSTGNQFIGNQSWNAVTNATLIALGQPSGVGYFFPLTGRVDCNVMGSPCYPSTTGYPLINTVFTGNWERYPATDSYRWDAAFGSTSTNWSGWTIRDNYSDGATAVGFHIVNTNNFPSYIFDGNQATNAGTLYTGVGALGFGCSATPSVAHGRMFFTQCSGATNITGFTGGTPNQAITILVKDSNSVFQFSNGAATIKGNGNRDFIGTAGDALDCTLDGTTGNWFCLVHHYQGLAQGNGATVTQSTSKTTDPPAFSPGAVSMRIQLAAGSIAGPGKATFTVTNPAIGVNDTFAWSFNGTYTAGAYSVSFLPAAGSVAVTITNISGGALNETPILQISLMPQ